MKISKRIWNFRNEIIRCTPKFPNNRETVFIMQEHSLGNLLIHYLNWAIRYVATRPRAVTVEPAVTSDLRWKYLRHSIRLLLSKVNAGENLTPYLSRQTHSRGYSPTASQSGTEVDRWADKDFLLNAMGFHHFHLGEKRDISGQVERTDDLLFAKVDRKNFLAIGIFDHSVFDFSETDMSTERTRLWQIFERHMSRGFSSGTVLALPPITTSGHTVHVVKTAQQYARIVRELDSKLDDSNFINELYDSVQFNPPTRPRFQWNLNFSDLVLHEQSLNHHFMIQRGFN